MGELRVEEWRSWEVTNAEFREALEDSTAKYAVEVFKYLRELPYDVSTKVIAHQLGKSQFDRCQLP